MILVRRPACFATPFYARVHNGPTVDRQVAGTASIVYIDVFCPLPESRGLFGWQKK